MSKEPPQRYRQQVRMVVGALIVKHVEDLNDEKTIRAIQENLHMQYLLRLERFTEKLVFVPELFILVRKWLDHDFFNMLTLIDNLVGLFAKPSFFVIEIN